MAPVTQLGLVLLATASLATAQRHKGRGLRHSHKKNAQKYDAPYGYSNSTSCETAGPTGGAGTTSSPIDITSTRTETITSTITDYITEEAPTGAYGTGAASGSVSGAAQPTCGGSVYVTVTDTVTVTAGETTSTSSAPAAATSTTTTTAAATTVATTAATSATTSASAATLPVYTSGGGYQAPSAASSSSAAPSSAPSSSASGPGPSTKRGCLYISPEDTKVCDILGAGNSGVSWSTNWDSSPDNGAGNLEYIPQLWGGIASNGFDHTTSWTQNAAAAIKNGATALMGYNEPDNSGQANMDAAAAFAIWNLVTDFKATNDITVISPCVTSTVTSAGYSGLNWLSEFQSAGAAWDATCVHFYEQCSTLTTTYDATPLTEFVQKAASQFGKPVWVTEFGCYDNPATEQMGYFLTGAVTALENESTCAHYAAFNAGLLVDTATSSLNVAGQAYVSIASS